MESIPFCKYCRFLIDSFLKQATSKTKLYIMINPEGTPPSGYKTIVACDICRRRIRKTVEEETDGFIVMIP
jgi:hypothetical protein